MPTRATDIDAAELAEEASAWAVGGGIITMALFPMALPLILLTVAAAIPLLLLVLPVVLLAAAVAGLRRLRRIIRVPDARTVTGSRHRKDGPHAMPC
jgi:hypothetical protein